MLKTHTVPKGTFGATHRLHLRDGERGRYNPMGDKPRGAVITGAYREARAGFRYPQQIIRFERPKQR